MAIQRAQRRGFTLLELLIVVVVISILIGLLLPMLGRMRFSAQVLNTTQRMDNIQKALSEVGIQEGSAAFVLQRDAGLGGVTDIKFLDGITPNPDPTVNPWLDVTKIHNFGFPWNKDDLLDQDDPVIAAPAVPAAISQGEPDAKQVGPGRRFVSTATLADLNPLKTVELMKLAANVLPRDDAMTVPDEALDAYQNDRSAKKGWNDAWGHPLVIVYGLFQPTVTAQAIPGPPPSTLINDRLKKASTVYQYNRSVYLAVASAGPVLITPLAGTPADLASIWSQTSLVCEASTWSSSSFASPPWSGTKLGKRVPAGLTRRYESLLSTPIEIK